MTTRIAALALLALIGGGCGSATPTAAVTTPSPPTLSPIRSPVEVTPSPPPSPPPAPSASSARATPPPLPTTATVQGHIANKTGQFSFDAPQGWAFLNCDPSYPGVGLAIRAGDTVHSVSCANEACWFSVMITAVAGDQTKDAPSKVGCMQYVSGAAETTITVDGATGNRITDTFIGTPDQTGGFGPDSGTEQVLYVVFNGQRTYYALYQRLPGRPDETAAFDRLMSSFAFA
jgi:hypothetical protein